jgi:hypothetical protein
MHNKGNREWTRIGTANLREYKNEPQMDAGKKISQKITKGTKVVPELVSLVLLLRL